MKNIFHYAAWLLFMGTLLFAGCSDEKEDSVPDVPEPSIDFGGEVDLKPVLGVDGGTSTLVFTASDDWTAGVSAITREIDWLSVSPTQGGAGTVTLQISARPNESYDERNAAVLLICGDVRKSITVTQKQKDALLLTSNKVEMEAVGGTFSIELQANVSVSYEIEEAAREWLTAASPSTRGLTASTLSFQVAENPDTEVRQAVITIKGGELAEQVTVYQAGSEPTILLSQKEYTVSSDGETIQVELKSNTSYEVVMPDASWITEVPTRAMSAYTHYFQVAANESYDARTAEIAFVNKENGLEEKITITQVQKDAILVAQNEYTVASEGGRLDFSVNTNVDFTIETSVDWIQQVTTRGLVEKPLSFTIAENVSNEQRQGVISIISGDLKQEIVVIQAGTPIILLDQKEYTVRSDGEIIQVDLQSNINYDIRISADWITEVSTRSLSTYTHFFQIASNEGYDARTAEIYFVDEENGLQEKVIVTQVQKDAIVLAEDEYTMDAAGGRLEFTVNANVDFSVETSVDWIQQVVTRGLAEKPLQFNIVENTTEASRQGVITIHSGELKQEIRVIQEGKTKAYLIVSSKEFTVPAEGGNIEFVVEANAEVAVTSSASWCYWNVGSSYTFIVESNTQPQQRKAEILVECPENGLSEIIYVMQEALVPQFDVLCKEVYVGAESWLIDSYYNISTNIDYFVNVENVDWLSITDSKIIDVSTNFQGERRQATVTVYNEEYGINQSYQLIQEAYPYLDLPLDVLTKGYINLSASEGSYIIPVHTDQEVSIAIDNSTWLTATSEGKNIKIQYEANTSDEMRSATLFVKIGQCKMSTNYQLFQEGGITSGGEIDDIIHTEW